MKIIFFSNYYTHHQDQICKQWEKLTNYNFYFISTELFSEERKELGWENEQASFVINYENDKKLIEIVDDADVFLLGSAPFELVKNSLKENKIVFKYSERIFKNGFSYIKWFPRIFKYWYSYGRYKSLYLLCASAYTAYDFISHGVFYKKSYKWGYFPKTIIYNLNELFSNKRTNEILWCGRLLDWKHPDDVIKVAKRLNEDGYDFRLNIIGVGPLEEKIKMQITEFNLGNKVFLLGAMKPDEVRNYMEKSGIYLLTSDFKEGWGAVLNEAMNSGCAVVASHAAGAVPYLIKNKHNGLIYKSGECDKLYKKVKYLLDYPDEQKKLGANAYSTIVNLWNAEVASKRFIKLTEQIKEKGFCDLYDDGPCSKAEIIKNDWFKEED